VVIWEIVEVQITEDQTLNEATELKAKQEGVETAVIEIMTRPVAKALLAVLDTAPTFVVVYFL
jgi:hypothetical protein